MTNTTDTTADLAETKATILDLLEDATLSTTDLVAIVPDGWVITALQDLMEEGRIRLVRGAWSLSPDRLASIKADIMHLIRDEPHTEAELVNTFHIADGGDYDAAVRDALTALSEAGEAKEGIGGIWIGRPTKEQWSDMQRAVAEAREAGCDVEGCGGKCATDLDHPDDWVHEITHGQIGDVQWTVDVLRGNTTASFYFPDDAYQLGAARLRALADEYAALPATLRALADEIDRRNA